jgi:hypothetical protein
MNTDQSGFTTPDKKLAAVCGLFCPACTIFIGSTEDPARLKAVSERLGLTTEEMECHGCRADKRGMFCSMYCKMTKCASEKGIDFCGECDEYPCAELKEFQAKMPHRIELWEAQARIKEVGYETWYSEMVEHFSCPSCGTINSAYDPACRKCGETPGSTFGRLHKDEIEKHINKITAKVTRKY